MSTTKFLDLNPIHKISQFHDKLGFLIDLKFLFDGYIRTSIYQLDQHYYSYNGNYNLFTNISESYYKHYIITKYLIHSTLFDEVFFNKQINIIASKIKKLIKNSPDIKKIYNIPPQVRNNKEALKTYLLLEKSDAKKLPGYTEHVYNKEFINDMCAFVYHIMEHVDESYTSNLETFLGSKNVFIIAQYINIHIVIPIIDQYNSNGLMTQLNKLFLPSKNLKIHYIHFIENRVNNKKFLQDLLENYKKVKLTDKEGGGVKTDAIKKFVDKTYVDLFKQKTVTEILKIFKRICIAVNKGNKIQ